MHVRIPAFVVDHLGNEQPIDLRLDVEGWTMTGDKVQATVGGDLSGTIGEFEFTARAPFQASQAFARDWSECAHCAPDTSCPAPKETNG